MDKRVPNINIKNRRASFDYIFTETFTAGLVLTGTEIKSIRQSKASLVDTYCTFINNELWVKNMHVQQPRCKARPQVAARAQGAAQTQAGSEEPRFHHCTYKAFHKREGACQAGDSPGTR